MPLQENLGVWIQWNGIWWTGMMEWWARASNKLGSITVIGIVVDFTHGKHILALNFLPSKLGIKLFTAS